MKIAIFGDGGHASEVADICFDLGYQDIVFIVPDLVINETYSDNLLPESEVYSLAKQGFSFAVGIIDGRTRQKISSKFSDYSGADFCRYL